MYRGEGTLYLLQIPDQLPHILRQRSIEAHLLPRHRVLEPQMMRMERLPVEPCQRHSRAVAQFRGAAFHACAVGRVAQ